MKLPQERSILQGLERQLRAPGADGGQEPLRVIGNEQEHAVFRRLLQHLQQGVLSRQAHILGPGKQVDLVVGLVGPDEDVRPGLPDQVNGNGLFLRIVHGDKVRVVSVQHLPADPAV